MSINVPKGNKYPDGLTHEWLALEYIGTFLEIVGGVPQLAEAHALTLDQLNAQAGGPLLRMEIMANSPDDDLVGNTARESLARVLLNPLYVHAILMICGKIRAEVLYDSEYNGGIRSMCAVVDHLQRLALQLADFANTVGATASIPSLDKLLQFWDNETAMTLSGVIDDRFLVKDVSPLSMDFCLYVWRLKLQDVWLPSEQYERCIQKLEGWESASRRLKKLLQRQQLLKDEYEQQKQRVEAVREGFVKISKNWLVADAQVGPNVTCAFVKHCIATRLFASEADAIFCGKLVDLMLELRLECFNFFDFTNCWTKMLMPLVRCCTEREAPLLAIFVSHTFGSIKSWSENQKEFELLVTEHPCFCTTFRFVPDKALTHQQLLCGIRKWEGRVLRALSYALGLQLCGDETNIPESNPTWIDQKGAIVFLARCHESFPITAPAGRRVLNCLKNVSKNAESNGWKDIVVSANTLLKTLEKYDREHKWI